jgi:hypothetical protein
LVEFKEALGKAKSTAWDKKMMLLLLIDPSLFSASNTSLLIDARLEKLCSGLRILEFVCAVNVIESKIKPYMKVCKGFYAVQEDAYPREQSRLFRLKP